MTRLFFVSWRAGLLALALGMTGLPAAAEQLFRIATGPQGATYFPIASGQTESGFSQPDMADWHYSGTGIVRPQFKLDKLRLIAILYPEDIHVVTRKSLALTSVARLKGLNVATDEPGSGVLVNARQILRAYGLLERGIKPAYIKGAAAAKRMKAGTITLLYFCWRCAVHLHHRAGRQYRHYAVAD